MNRQDSIGAGACARSVATNQLERKNRFDRVIFTVNEKSFFATRMARNRSDGGHFEVVLACAAFRARPVHRHVGPAGTWCDAVVRRTDGFVVHPTADQAHPRLERLRFVTHGNSLKSLLTKSFSIGALPDHSERKQWRSRSAAVLTYGRSAVAEHRRTPMRRAVGLGGPHQIEWGERYLKRTRCAKPTVPTHTYVWPHGSSRCAGHSM